MKLHTDSHSEHCHLPHMSGLHLYQGLMFYRSVCSEVSVCGHADTGGGVVCVCCVYLCAYVVCIYSRFNWIPWKQEEDCFESEIWWGFNFYRKRNCVELLVGGRLFPTCIFLFFSSCCYWSLLFSRHIHIEQVHFSCNDRRACFSRKVTALVRIKFTTAFFFSETVSGSWETEVCLMMSLSAFKHCENMQGDTEHATCHFAYILYHMDIWQFPAKTNNTWIMPFRKSSISMEQSWGWYKIRSNTIHELKRLCAYVHIHVSMV